MNKPNNSENSKLLIDSQLNENDFENSSSNIDIDDDNYDGIDEEEDENEGLSN